MNFTDRCTTESDHKLTYRYWFWPRLTVATPAKPIKCISGLADLQVNCSRYRAFVSDFKRWISCKLFAFKWAIKRML